MSRVLGRCGSMLRAAWRLKVLSKTPGEIHDMPADGYREKKSKLSST